MSKRAFQAYGAIALAFASTGAARADTCAEEIRAYESAVADLAARGWAAHQSGRACIASPRSSPSPGPMRRRRSMRSTIGRRWIARGKPMQSAMKQPAEARCRGLAAIRIARIIEERQSLIPLARTCRRNDGLTTFRRKNRGSEGRSIMQTTRSPLGAAGR